MPPSKSYDGILNFKILEICGTNILLFQGNAWCSFDLILLMLSDSEQKPCLSHKGNSMHLNKDVLFEWPMITPFSAKIYIINLISPHIYCLLMHLQKRQWADLEPEIQWSNFLTILFFWKCLINLVKDCSDQFVFSCNLW